MLWRDQNKWSYTKHILQYAAVAWLTNNQFEAPLIDIRVLSLVENLFKKKPLQDFLSSLNAVISTNESTEFITGHVIYNPDNT